MPIEITGQPTSQLPTTNSKEGTSVQVGRNDSSAAQQETGTPSSLDTVSLTDSAALMQKMEDIMNDVPVVDTQRVADIQRALADGTFEIDSTRVAEKMLNFESSLAL